MLYFFCPTKGKNVNAYTEGIPASALEDYKPVVISGRIKCSGSDRKCTKENCPLLKSKEGK